MKSLEDIGIPVEDMSGQRYDGASNMSSQRVGVQARIREKFPLAIYIHCSGHCPNLVIAHSCALPEVRNVLDKLKNCCRFFQKSPKRNYLLELGVRKGVGKETERKALLDLCRTRWALRHKTYNHFYQAYTYLVETLEMIGYRGHIEKHGDLYDDWDTANRSEAQQIIASITCFHLIVVFMDVYQYLSHLSGISTHLQSTALDSIEAHSMVGILLIIYVLFIILPLIYTEVILNLLACSCFCETYANGHVPKRTVHNYIKNQNFI